MTQHRRMLMLSAAAGIAVFVLLWIGYVQQWPWLTAMDSAALNAAYRFGADRSGWIVAWDAWCTAMGPGTFRIIGAVVIVVALWRRYGRLALYVVVTLELSGLLVEILKSIADRPRPSTAFVHAAATSFPSGHALGVMVYVPAVCVLAWPYVRKSLRPWLIAFGVLVVLTIGGGRVVLNVHNPSDVLAGWALGYAYVVVCTLLLPPRTSATAAVGRPEALDSARETEPR